MIFAFGTFGVGMDDTDDIKKAQEELDAMNDNEPEVPIEWPEHPDIRDEASVKPAKPLTEGKLRGGNGFVKPRKKKKKEEMSPQKKAELKRSFYIFCTFVLISIGLAFSMYQCSQYLKFETETHKAYATYLDDAKLQDGIYLAASKIQIDEDFTMFEDLKVNYSEVSTFKQLRKAPVDVHFKFRRDGRRLDIIVVAAASGEILSVRETYDKKTINNIKRLLRPDVPPPPKDKVKVVIESDRFKRKPVK